MLQNAAPQTPKLKKVKLEEKLEEKLEKEN